MNKEEYQEWFRYKQFKEKLLASTTQEHRDDIRVKTTLNLEDVFVAVNNKFLQRGIFLNGIYKSWWFDIINKAQWKLGKPAHLQSDETLKELIDLF